MNTSSVILAFVLLASVLTPMPAKADFPDRPDSIEATSSNGTYVARMTPKELGERESRAQVELFERDANKRLTRLYRRELINPVSCDRLFVTDTGEVATVGGFGQYPTVLLASYNHRGDLEEVVGYSNAERMFDALPDIPAPTIEPKKDWRPSEQHHLFASFVQTPWGMKNELQLIVVFRPAHGYLLLDVTGGMLIDPVILSKEDLHAIVRQIAMFRKPRTVDAKPKAAATQPSHQHTYAE